MKTSPPSLPFQVPDGTAAPRPLAPTVRSLARALNLSPTTVSEALRGVPRVKPATQHLVRAAAEAYSYRPNPLASAVMSEMRRSRRALFRGMLAATTLDEATRPVVSRGFFNRIIAGATRRANELGFGLETFLIGERGIRLPRLDTILQSRGIRGLILLPAWDTPDFSKLDWSRYTGVYTDYIIERPALHAICSDHYRSMMIALQRLHDLGYRRPGLFLRRQHDERLQHRWEAAFLAFQQHAPDLTKVPPLVREEIERQSFVSWFNDYKPDIVLGHDPRALPWMVECGADVPRTHGFFSLNLVGNPEPCAGLDLQPDLIGARAAEIAIGQLHRNEFGIPEHPSLTTMVARWVDGPTIRPAKVP